MKPLDDLLPRILPRVKHCPEPVALAAIRTATVEFCERTRLWRNSDCFNVKANCCAFVCVPKGAVLFEIESARFEGLPLEPVSLTWLENNIADWRNKTETAAKWITQMEPDTVRVVPSAEGKVDLSLVLKPSHDATELPDFLITHHGRTLADGALAELMTMPDQPFMHPDLAGFHGQRFTRDLDRLSTASIQGQQRAPVRTTPNFF